MKPGKARKVWWDSKKSIKFKKLQLVDQLNFLHFLRSFQKRKIFIWRPSTHHSNWIAVPLKFLLFDWCVDYRFFFFLPYQYQPKIRSSSDLIQSLTCGCIVSPTPVENFCYHSRWNQIKLKLHKFTTFNRNCAAESDWKVFIVIKSNQVNRSNNVKCADYSIL